MSIQTYYDLKEMLCRELEEITRKGELTAGSLDTVDKLTYSIKSISTIIAMEEADGESGMYPYWGGRAFQEGGNRGGGSNQRGGGGRSNQRRDSRGRYSRENRGGGYSREDDREDMIEDLRELMQSAPDEHTKRRFQSFIRELENS